VARWLPLLGRAVVSGTVASLTSTAALALAARAEGRGAVQPLNATSHWLHGPAAAQLRHVDPAHTGVGYATHHAATIFWAMLFEGLLARRPAPSSGRIVRDAAITGTVAAAVDYLATPQRFTPGWEYVLSKRSMALTYAALAAGLAIGAYGRGATGAASSG
jgi:hypothetical protein